MIYQFLEFRSVVNLRNTHLKEGADVLVGGAVTPGTTACALGLSEVREQP